MKTISDLVNESTAETIRGILIDPANKTCEEVKLHKELMMQHMAELMECDYIERIVDRSHKMQINLDEEGTFKQNNQPFIFYPTTSVYPDSFVGKAIVTGYDFESLPDDITLGYIKANTQFLA